jgi:hypothetical protein
VDATGRPVVVKRDQRRHRLAADILAFRASRLEGASRRQSRQRGHGAFDSLKPLAAYAAGFGLQASDSRQ